MIIAISGGFGFSKSFIILIKKMNPSVFIFSLEEFPGYKFKKVGEGAYGEVFLGQSVSGNNIIVKRIKDE